MKVIRFLIGSPRTRQRIWMASPPEVRKEIESRLLRARSLIPDRIAERVPENHLDPSVPRLETWETQLWDIGEQIRQLLASAPALRRDEDLGRQFLEISLDRRAGGGRQSFMMLLGFKSFAALAKELTSELVDDVVCGHVVWALYRAKVPGQWEQVRSLCDHERAWIRKEARRYVAWDTRLRAV
jgi:hypothetical protein